MKQNVIEQTKATEMNTTGRYAAGLNAVEANAAEANAATTNATEVNTTGLNRLHRKRQRANMPHVAHAVYGSFGNTTPHVAHAVYGKHALYENTADSSVNSEAAQDAVVSQQTTNAENTSSNNNAYAATFKRTEKKYCLSTKQYQALMPYIKRYMQPDAYPQTVVSSLYFDTPENRLISRSLEKPLYKEKLRIRSYGIEQENGTVVPVSDQVFVELKKKYKGVVYKRRLALSTNAARAFLSGMDIQEACTLFPVEAVNATENAKQAEEAEAPTPTPLTFQECQVAREISVFLKRYENLQPAMITRCTRNAFKQEDSQLRITFDSNLYAGHPAGDPFAFQLDVPAMNLLQPGQVLMEIKQAGGLPLWLVHALSVNHIYPRSFSKYGTAYEKELKNA